MHRREIDIDERLQVDAGSSPVWRSLYLTLCRIDDRYRQACSRAEKSRRLVAGTVHM